MGVDGVRKGSLVSRRRRAIWSATCWRRVVEVLLAAEDVGHAHEFIVDDDGEVVCGEAVGLSEDEVVGVLGLEGDVAQDAVGDVDGRAWVSEADDAGLAGAESGERGVAVISGVAGVSEGLLAFGGGASRGVDLVLGVEGGVGLVLVDHPIDVGVVDVEALRLEEWADGARVAADAVGGACGSLIPADAEPGEVLEDSGDGLLAGSCLVGVLDAEDEGV